MKSLQRHLALFLSALLIAGHPVHAFAATLKTIHAEWEFGGTATSYRLYQEGILLCESFDTTNLAVDCDTFIGTDPITFTMTAIGADGETPHSAPFTLVPPTIDEFGNYVPTPSFTTSVTTGQVPLQVSFDASASSDFDGSLVAYEWDFGDGDTGTGMVAGHTFDLPGTYSAALTVTDNGGATATATTTIIVSDTTPTIEPTNQLPTAVINAVAVSASSYQFNADGSADTDGTIVSYSWNFGDGTTATGASAEHEYAAAGTYTVTLTVTDDDNAAKTAQTSITVAETPAQNEPPVAVISIGTSQHKITADWEYNDTSTVSAFRLYQNNSFICETIDPNATQVSCLTYLENRPMAFAVKAVDTDGNESLFSEQLTYSPEPESVSLEGDAPFAVFFNGGSSTDADGSITSYHWDFGDGDTASTSAATHTFPIGGIYTVTLSATDNDGNTTSTTSAITVLGNTPPVALATTINTNEDTAATGTLRASDADDDALSFTIAVNGSKGKAVITNSSTGAFTYTPTADANGTDTFTFVAHDGTTYSNIGTTTVNIAAVNDQPVVTSSSLTTPEDTPVSSGVAATDPDNDPLAFTIGTNGSLGTAVITNSGTGAFTYTPHADQNGSDSFTVNVSDGTVSKSATVSVTITAANDAPTAVNDIAAATSGVPVTIPVLANDSDIDGDTVSLAQALPTAHGTTSISGSDIIYTSEASFSGEDTFTYTVSDGKGGSATGSVTITVTPQDITTPPEVPLPQITLPDTMMVTIAWEYNLPITVTEFRIYRNGEQVGKTSDPNARELTLSVPVTSELLSFSFTYVKTNGTESKPINITSFVPTEMLINYKLAAFYWDYTDSSAVKRFKIYMNGNQVCETADATAREITCFIPKVDESMEFTITAIDANDIESELSNSLKY